MIKDFKEVIHLYYGAPCMFGIKVPGQETEFEKFTINIRVLHAVLNDLGEVRPILRKLESMTEEEKSHIGHESFQMLRSEQGDLRLPSRSLSCQWAARQTAYLLSKHFDLFGLIDNNLAISKE